MNILRKLRDWAIGPKGWLISDATSQEQNDLSRLDKLDGQRDVAWIEQASNQDINQHPTDIHIIHHADLGYNYWYTNGNGFLTAGTHYPTEGKAWRAALLEQEHEAATHADDDYPN